MLTPRSKKGQGVAQGWVVRVWNGASRLEFKLKEIYKNIKKIEHEKKEGTQSLEKFQHKLVARNKIYKRVLMVSEVSSI